MPWFRVDDTFAHHAKVMAAGNGAVGLWTRAGAWCMQQLTDGFVPDHVAATLGSKSEAKRLVDVGLWLREDDGYRFHQWEGRQPSREKVEADRHAATERQRVARERAKSQRESRRDSQSDKGVSHGPPDPTRPDPTHKDLEAEADAPAPPGRSLALVNDTRPDVDRLCDHLADQIEARGAKRPTVTARWRNEARLLLDNDGRTEEQAHAAIRWLFTSTHRDAEFWRTNVRSMPKLRAEYDRLRELSQRSPSGGRQQETDDLFDRAARRMGVTNGGAL